MGFASGHCTEVEHFWNLSFFFKVFFRSGYTGVRKILVFQILVQYWIQVVSVDFQYFLPLLFPIKNLFMGVGRGGIFKDIGIAHFKAIGSNGQILLGPEQSASLLFPVEDPPPSKNVKLKNLLPYKGHCKLLLNQLI